MQDTLYPNVIKDKKGNTIEIKISWCIEDVLQQAENNDIKLTKKEASAVLDEAYHRHDANMGVNWEVLEYHIDQVIGERK